MLDHGAFWESHRILAALVRQPVSFHIVPLCAKKAHSRSNCCCCLEKVSFVQKSSSLLLRLRCFIQQRLTHIPLSLSDSESITPKKPAYIPQWYLYAGFVFICYCIRAAACRLISASGRMHPDMTGCLVLLWVNSDNMPLLRGRGAPF